MTARNKYQIVGWIAVALSTAITCFWAFWGIIENFHEGWYYESLLSNVGLMFVQYLSPMLLFMVVALVSVVWPRLGAGLHGVLCLLIAWFFQAWTNAVLFFLLVPFLGLGALYWFGRPQPRKVAIALIIGLPVLTLAVSTIEPVLRVSQRVDDGNVQARLVEGNGVSLTWAPAGPGWPDQGADWYEAMKACRYLGEDGLMLTSEPKDLWRLPTVEEAVRSMARHGKNSGGVWDAEAAEATYAKTPDKESPLWSVYSPVIYWWTATEVDEEHARIIVYDGEVWVRSKEFGPDYLGYRCVR